MKDLANIETTAPLPAAPPSEEQLEAVLAHIEAELTDENGLVAETYLQRITDDHGGEEPPASAGAENEPSPRPKPGNGTLHEAAVTATGLAGGEAARRAIVDARAREAVIKVARRVASKKTRGMTDAQVAAFIRDNSGFRNAIRGHLHEHLDAVDIRQIYELRKKFNLSPGRVLELYPEHNRPGLDGVYKGARKAGSAVFAQHKDSQNPVYLKEAARKVGKGVRAKTELVVTRGTKVNEATKQGLKGFREAGRRSKDLTRMIDVAADPSKVTKAGANAADKITAKAGGAAAVVGVGISVAADARKVYRGEKSAVEAAENAAWAGSEAAVSTVASAAVTTAAAPTIAAGVTALAGSSALGTTAAAAGLAALGPVGVGIGVGVGVSIGVKVVRNKVRG